jgi:hypothetical protein
MAKDMKALVNACLHCLPTRGGVRIPRPLGTQIHATKPNEIIHMDWIYAWPMKKNGLHEYQWNLILRDDISGLVKITPARVPDTEVTVDALLEWRALFGTPKILVSDMASYFVSEVMKKFAHRCNVKQHITTAYGHYNNGSIEVINKCYLSLIRALLSELRWDKEYWPWLNSNIEHTLNHRPQSRLNGNAPVTVMTGLPADNPLDEIFKNPETMEFIKFPISKKQIQKSVDDLQSALAQMHRQVEETSRKQRATKKASSSQYRKEPNFGIGDYVLVGVAEPAKMTGRKLFLKWRGPYRVVDSQANYVFEAEDILDSSRRWIHGDRVRFYEDSKLNVTEEIKRQFAHDNENFLVENLKSCRRNSVTDQLELLVEWRGFSAEEDSWEPLKTLNEDIPVKVRNYVKTLKAEGHELADAAFEFIQFC